MHQRSSLLPSLFYRSIYTCVCTGGSTEAVGLLILDARVCSRTHVCLSIYTDRHGEVYETYVGCQGTYRDGYIDEYGCEHQQSVSVHAGKTYEEEAT